jgi:hypothetical protein
MSDRYQYEKQTSGRTQEIVFGCVIEFATNVRSWTSSSTIVLRSRYSAHVLKTNIIGH